MKTVIYSAEAVVLDDRVSRFVSYSTDDEAICYILERKVRKGKCNMMVLQ